MNPESTNFDSESAVAPDLNKAITELNEKAAQTDMPQDQYDTTLASIENAHVGLESTFAVPEAAADVTPEATAELADTEVVAATPEVVEAPAAEADLGGRAVRAAVDIVGAIEDAHATAQAEERSHAAADAALNYAKEREELLGLEEAATHNDWPQDKLEAAQAEVKAKYAESK